MDSDITLSDAKPVVVGINADTEFFFAPTGVASYWDGARWVMLDELCNRTGWGDDAG